MSKKVFPDTSAMRHWPKEDCVDCRTPTRYWVKGGFYPLCPKCAKKPNAGHGAHIYLERMGQCLKGSKLVSLKSKPIAVATEPTTTGTSRSSRRKGSRGRSSSAR